MKEITLSNEFIRLQKITAAACSQKSNDLDLSKRYRSEAFLLEQSIFDVYQQHDSNLGFLLAIKDIVSSLRLKKLSCSPIGIETQNTQGSFLLLSLNAIMYDELAMCYSEGFFDSSNFPPVDCWLEFVLFDSEKNNEAGYLISWVPEDIKEIVSEGVSACSGNSLFFSTDLEFAKEYHGNEAVELCNILNNTLI